MKKTFILLIVITLPLISFSQNRQNKYYNPLRFSLSGITKVVLESDENHTDKYSFDQGIGLIGELIYTIDERAKYEISKSLVGSEMCIRDRELKISTIQINMYLNLL